MSAYFVEPALRRVPVDAMVAVPPATSLTVRVFEEGPDPVATLQVDSASPSLTAIRAIIQDGQPEWNWFGRKLKLDDPSFPAPIYASLVDADDGYSLIWSRANGSN